MRQAGLGLELLTKTHDLSRFESGNAELDTWLRRHAVAAQQTDTARTFLLLNHADVVGYFSLTMGSVVRSDAPPRLVRGPPRYPVGVVLLARLAVTRTFQGQGMGGLLLSEALRKAVVAGEAATARLIVVDAADEAASRFYAHDGFLAIPDRPLRLYRTMKDVRASLGSSGAAG